MDAHGKLDGMAHECPCGSLVCERCRPDLLFRIFEDRYLDLFEEWRATILMDPPPLGYDWQWEDLLREKGCEQVVGEEEASNRGFGFVVIPCPNGESLLPEHRNKGDRSVRILVPRDYADKVLAAGKMV